MPTDKIYNSDGLQIHSSSFVRATAVIGIDDVFIEINEEISMLLGENSKSLVGSKIDISASPIAKMLMIGARKCVSEGRFSENYVSLMQEGDAAETLLRLRFLPIHTDADNNDRAMVIAESIAQPSGEVQGHGVGRRSTRRELAVTHTAVEKFLLSTLVTKLALRARAGARYATLRSWRNPIREFQIDALQALKSQMPASFVDVVASEIVDAVRLIYGGEAFNAVVPVPSSRGRLGDGFSERVARAVARKANSEFIAALAIAPTTGSSHPRKNVKRPAMRRLADLANKIVLIVDDVATSGSHIEEATRLVRESARSSFAVAWIGGNAEK